jgi:Asp-tRNA(Asn)/Glu-tRNA(Gln) amidotransferase A subunit family amidase
VNTATEARQAIADRRLGAEDFLEGCLKRIEEREGLIGAWEYLDAASARRQARAIDAARHPGRLAGIPVGIKDIIDTSDMPTAHGSPIYAGNRPSWDAACVALLRAAGAVIPGKTVTTEFAYFQPGKTRNPRAPEHTPGGSSSGSAAAVADAMVPVALGTQTAASVIRPAAYCGIVGYKATHGSFSLAGVKAFSPSLDTLGILARSVADVALVRQAMLDADEALPDIGPPRFGLCRTAHWSAADASTRRAVERTADQLKALGASVAVRDWPSHFAELTEAQKSIMAFEAARSYAHERFAHPGRLSGKLTELLETGLACSLSRYRDSLALAETCRGELARFFDGIDAVISPSAPGEAPKGLAGTGDPIFNRAWTLLHVPSVTLPLATGDGGLPVGVQFVADRHQDGRLLALAAWIERRWPDFSSAAFRCS